MVADLIKTLQTSFCKPGSKLNEMINDTIYDGACGHIPDWSSSVSAVMTLIPKGWGTTDVHQFNDGMWIWGLWKYGTLEKVTSTSCSEYPSIVICIAALKAREIEDGCLKLKLL